MTTYKILIENKYNELLKEIEGIIDISDELMPNLDDETNWVELIKYIEFIFPDENTSYNISELFEFKDIEISTEQIDKLVPIIDKYLKFMKTIKKYIISK